jgi:hypothetical protein
LWDFNNSSDFTILQSLPLIGKTIIFKHSARNTLITMSILHRTSELISSPFLTEIFPNFHILRVFAQSTWDSFDAMAYPNGLPADNLNVDGQASRYTSPTNIAAYLWSTLAAQRLKLITDDETIKRLRTTLQTLSGLERHTSSGQFYYWYDPQNGDKLRTWPVTGKKLKPFLSSVDNAWLATALWLIVNSCPGLANEASRLLDEMDFGFYYDPSAGLLRGGYWPEPPLKTAHIHGFTCHHYGSVNSETRIASYVGIASGQLPPEHYFKMWRTLPPHHPNIFQRGQPEGSWKTYLGVKVYQGYYRAYGMQVVPSWGGGMFEALMPSLFVPETDWGQSSWGFNHLAHVYAQISYGLIEKGYKYWGVSPACSPEGGYGEYGVPALAMNPDNRRGVPVVTPHASFLALPFAPQQALANLQGLQNNFDCYGKWGFWDAVNVKTGQTARSVLALDQGMIMAAITNFLCKGFLQDCFSRGCVEQSLRPLLEMENFGLDCEAEATFSLLTQPSQ